MERTEMGRELPLVVVDSPFGILAEKPRLRINSTYSTSCTRAFPFFSLRDDCYTALLLMVGKLHVRRGMMQYMKLYERAIIAL